MSLPAMRCLVSPASPSQADPIPSGWHQVSLALQVILIVSYSSISQPLTPCRYPCLQPCPSLWTSAPPWHLQAGDYSSLCSALGLRMTSQCFPSGDSLVTLLLLVSLQVILGVMQCLVSKLKTSAWWLQGAWAHVPLRWTEGVPWGWTLLRVPDAWLVTVHLGTQG